MEIDLFRRFVEETEVDDYSDGMFFLRCLLACIFLLFDIWTERSLRIALVIGISLSPLIIAGICFVGRKRKNLFLFNTLSVGGLVISIINVCFICDTYDTGTFILSQDWIVLGLLSMFLVTLTKFLTTNRIKKGRFKEDWGPSGTTVGVASIGATTGMGFYLLFGEAISLYLLATVLVVIITPYATEHLMKHYYIQKYGLEESIHVKS